ncbi:HEPN domain-containing protein [Candidatus Pyrohabitans sp.]
MDKEVDRWLKRADTDLRVAKKLLELNEEPWVIAYHAEQATEKYLKAFLVHEQKRFRKTHNIKELLDKCIEADEEFEKLRQLDVEYLSEYATEVRYPGFYEPTRGEAEEAINVADRVGKFVMGKLKPPT